MVNPHKVINKIIGKHKYIKGDYYSRNKKKDDKFKMDLKEVNCYICGKVTTYPTYRFGRALCAKCATAGDKAYKERSKWYIQSGRQDIS